MMKKGLVPFQVPNVLSHLFDLCKGTSFQSTSCFIPEISTRETVASFDLMFRYAVQTRKIACPNFKELCAMRH